MSQRQLGESTGHNISALTCACSNVEGENHIEGIIQVGQQLCHIPVESPAETKNRVVQSIWNEPVTRGSPEEPARERGKRKSTWVVMWRRVHGQVFRIGCVNSTPRPKPAQKMDVRYVHVARPAGGKHTLAHVPWGTPCRKTTHTQAGVWSAKDLWLSTQKKVPTIGHRVCRHYVTQADQRLDFTGCKLTTTL